MSQDSLFEIGPFQMQSWSAVEPCICPIDRPVELHNWHGPKCRYPYTTRRWVPMENGAAKSAWKPRKTARDAVHRAAAWAGAFLGWSIPAMRVVDQASGAVVWCASYDTPAAGPVIEPDWAFEVYAEIRRELAAEASAEAAS